MPPYFNVPYVRCAKVLIKSGSRSPAGQLTVPALQCAASRACVACGAVADAFCAQCGVTPYCSVACQRRDWADRHRSVCHNLARQSKLSDTSDAVLNNIPTAAPLRRPHSPVTQPRRDNVNNKMQKKPSPAPHNYSKYNGRSASNNERRQHPMTRANNRDHTKDGSPEVEDDWSNANKTTSNYPQPKIASKEEPTPAPRPEVAPAPKSVPAAKVEVKPPAKLSEVMPAKRIVPKNYVIELLPVGEKVLLSVDATGADCRSAKPGFVCLTMHESYQTQYQALIETYVVACDADNEDYTPKPGESFSYFNPEDSGWYRARCLSDKQAALLDSSKLVDIDKAKVKKLSGEYESYPEFCCLLSAEKVKVGDSLSCTILSKTGDSIRVSVENIESGAALGQGEVSRWLPTVDYATLLSAPVQGSLPSVPRPDLVNNVRVFLVEAAALDCIFVRPTATVSQRRYDAVLQDAVLYGRSANPLKEPPSKGQVVIAKFTDGLHYRAMCKRTNVKQNKYMLEYIDFGNTEISQLENLYPCPPNLDLPVTPTEASRATLHCAWSGALSKAAIEYLNALKDDNVELTLTLPSGAQSAASGSPVTLTVLKNNENVNRKVQELCTPDWKKIEERGGDVVELECLHYKLLEYPELPAGGCELDISDVAGLDMGVLSGCPKNLPHALHVMTTLTERIADYCNSELGREPYLPKSEELCIAPCPPYPQWFRAVLMEHFTGSPTAKVCYVDYGNVEDIEVKMIRKMLPEFVNGEPALAIHIEIRDFPKPATPEMIMRAIDYLQLDDGRGTLRVTRCERIEHGMYVVDAPDFVRAVLGK